MPQCPEDYLHRIGRTARAGAEGEAICFISKQDKSKWDAIDRLMNPDAKPKSEKGRSSKNFKGKSKTKNNKFKNKFGKKPSNSNKRFTSSKPKRNSGKRKSSGRRAAA